MKESYPWRSSEIEERSTPLHPSLTITSVPVYPLFTVFVLTLGSSPTEITGLWRRIGCYSVTTPVYKSFSNLWEVWEKKYPISYVPPGRSPFFSSISNGFVEQLLGDPRPTILHPKKIWSYTPRGFHTHKVVVEPSSIDFPYIRRTGFYPKK